MPGVREWSKYLEEIDQAVLVLFNLVTEALSRATSALLDQDVPLAQQVIADDASVDLRCEEVIALVKDGLSDSAIEPERLETLVDILQIIPELERSADLAEHIAQRTLAGLGGIITPQSRGLIQSMSDIAISMWRSATAAYEHRSRDAGIALNDADNKLDELAAALVARGAESTETKVAMDLALCARFYERLGDHAVNLARRVDTMAAPRRLSGVSFSRGHRVGPTKKRNEDSRGWVARLRRFRLGPGDDSFFELFVTAAQNARDCADELNKLVTAFSDIDERCGRIRELEHRGDQVTVETLRLLDASFVTPYDREDIHALIEEIDDVSDNIFSAASTIQLSRFTEPLPELAEQTAVLVAMTDELEALLEGLGSGTGARHRLERIEHLEREGDAIHRRALARLFSGAFEALDVIVWKDVLQAIEDSLNSVEDVSDVVESILVKNS